MFETSKYGLAWATARSLYGILKSRALLWSPALDQGAEQKKEGNRFGVPHLLRRTSYDL